MAVGDIPPQVPGSAGASIGSFLYEPKGENEKKKEETLRMLLIGKTGSGKSSTGNTICNKEQFKSKMSASCITQDCKVVKGQISDRSFTLVDTPGLCQPGYSDLVLMKKIAKGIAMVPPGPHIFLLVLPIGSCSREDAEMVKVITDHLGDDVKKFMIVIFTHKDILDNEKITLEEYIKSLPSNVKKFVSDLNKRYISFNNKDSNMTQVKELFDMVDSILKKNEGQSFSIKLSQEAHKLKFKTELPKLSEKNRSGQLVKIAESEMGKCLGDEMEDEFEDDDMDVKIQLLHLKEKVRMKEIETTHRAIRSQTQQQEIDDLNSELHKLKETVRDKEREINDSVANDKHQKQEMANLYAQLAHEQEQIRCRDRFIEDLLMELKLTKNKHHKLEKKFGECTEKLHQFSRQKLEDIYRQSPNRPMTAKKSLPICTICCDRQLESFVIPCGHAFCGVCLTEVSERYKKCPKCRKRFKNCGTLYV